MTRKTVSRKSIRFLLAACLLLASPGRALAEDQAVAAVLSQKIKPYMQVLQGVREGLESEDRLFLDVFSLSSSGLDEEYVKKRLVEKPYDIFLAIGPEAAGLVWSMETSSRRGRIFSAILAPEKIDRMTLSDCGVSLRIPIAAQLAEITAALPGVKTIGLLFDPNNNQSFFETARDFGLARNVEIFPLAAKSKADIPGVLKDELDVVDAVWMIPDQTIISEKIVQYVIKQSLYRKKGVIGYNGFFIKSGAVFAFEFDYVEIGTQTANMIKAYARGDRCTVAAPVFQTTINHRMIENLGMAMEAQKK